MIGILAQSLFTASRITPHGAVAPDAHARPTKPTKRKPRWSAPAHWRAPRCADLFSRLRMQPDPVCKG